MPLPPALAARPFTAAEARSAGLSRRRLRAGDLVSPCHGVRMAAAETAAERAADTRTAPAVRTLLDRACALAAATGAVVSHLSAAVLWGFPFPLALECRAAVHLTTPPGKRAVRRKDVVGHSQALEPDEITTGGRTACTSPLRTWFDLAAVLGPDELVIAGDFLFRRRNPLATMAALDAYLARRRGMPGYRRATDARALIRAGTDSPKESELRLLLVRHGLPEPGINVPLLDATGGWVQDPDMSYEEEKIALQYDGGHHATAAQRRSDILRDEDARDAGWQVLVFTQRDLEPAGPGREPRAVTRVRAALLDRGWTPPRP